MTVPLPQDVIRKKRDRQALSEPEIRSFVEGITRGTVSEGQIGAFTMSVFLNGMDRPEVLALTTAMRDSGVVLDWGKVGVDAERVIEKHSSGGVGDEKVTLIVAPLAAACGVRVPNLSARGLDYCAGEVDLLDSIPGYRTAPSVEQFTRAVRAAGCAIIGPTRELAPADAKIYYVRDVTATVESVALITGSIVAKKLAVSPRGLVVSVGFGSGAYMAFVDHARELAHSMADVAAGAHVPSVMLLTDLNCVLGRSVGNAVAVVEALEFLTGIHQEARVRELSLAIVAEMILLAGLAENAHSARRAAEERLGDGGAVEHFGRMVAALGGPQDFVEHYSRYLPRAGYVQAVFPDRAGFVARMDARTLGHALVALGGGRKRPNDEIDSAVGLTEVTGIGSRVDAVWPLCVLHARDEVSWQHVAPRVRAAFTIADVPSTPPPIIVDRIYTPPVAG